MNHEESYFDGGLFSAYWLQHPWQYLLQLQPSEFVSLGVLHDLHCHRGRRLI